LIQTLHKSKGRTYQSVFLPFMNGNFEWLGDADEDLAYINKDIASDVARRN
jgi:ATP-dependent exoDNAse (exonuclease V) beta subunit